jgi:hypothetical protein
VFFASGPPPRFAGLSCFGAGLLVAPRFAPLAVVLIPPKDFLQHRVEDVVGVALDEPGIVFEELVDWLLEFYFPSHDPWCFPNDWHDVPPLLICVVSELAVTVEKTAGTIYRAAGRERSHELFGRLKAEKVGPLPPVLVFFSRRLSFASLRYLPRCKRNCSRRA